VFPAVVKKKKGVGLLKKTIGATFVEEKGNRGFFAGKEDLRKKEREEAAFSTMGRKAVPL